MEIQPQPTDKAYGLLKQYIATQPTIPVPAVKRISDPTDPELSQVSTPGNETRQSPRKKLRSIRLLAITLSILLAIILFFAWHTFSQHPTTSSISPQTFTASEYSSPTSQIVHAATPESSGGAGIQVYIVGAVKHPGVYTLSDTARVYQLLQAAGGPLSNANLIELNLAAKLSDGQEIYVAAIGEVVSATPASIAGPAGSTSPALPGGQLVNINAATADTMRQNLHIATTTAQNIVTYRLNHGNFTSVDQLLQVVSKNIYNKIKGQVTLS